MNYIHETSDQAVTDYLFDRLATPLRRGKSVLWLVPGGSAIHVATLVADRMRDEGVPVTKLTITPTDERYGPVGHADENYQQLIDAGFSLPGATLHRVLKDGLSRTETAAHWSRLFDETLAQDVVAVGFFGIGADGHTSGIKPHAFEDMAVDEYVLDYTWEDYERITTTPYFIARLDEVIAYANGNEKKPALTKLMNETLPVTEQPAQCLKLAAHAALFTDQEIITKETEE